MNELIHETTEEAQHSSRLVGYLMILLLSTCCACLIAVWLVMSGGGYTFAEMLTRIFQ
jgi:heme/copper-type cytochrome/quinol oxidase subunit 4